MLLQDMALAARGYNLERVPLPRAEELAAKVILREEEMV
jgi:hypothetical protein